MIDINKVTKEYIDTTISGSSGSILTVNNGLVNYSQPSTKYIVLGTEIEIDSYYTDYNLANSIALINTLGKPYYDEIKKQNISFPDKIEEFLEKEFKIIERDNKIKQILNKD